MLQTYVHNMFTIDRNKSLVNFTVSNVLRLQKPNHASDLTVGGVWYQRVHCLNLSHSQRGNVCCTNCIRQLSTLYWTHHMTHQLKWNNWAGCMRKRSLLSRCPTYNSFLFWCFHIKVKQSRNRPGVVGPEGSRKFRLSDFHDIQHMKVVRLSASRTGLLYLQECSSY